MEDNKNETISEFTEDICSSKSMYRKLKKEKYKNANTASFKYLGTIVKVISFIVAFFIMAVSFVIGFLLYSKDPLFKAVCAVIIIFGTATAAVFLFIIFAIGHAINQNDQILQRLDK